MLASCRETIVARDTRIICRRHITEVQSMQAAHDSEVQQVQTECHSQLESAKEAHREEIARAEEKISKHERELERLNKWGDYIEQKCTMVTEMLEEADQKKRELKAEVTELKRQNQERAADLEHERVTARAEFQRDDQRLKEQLEAAQRKTEELEKELVLYQLRLLP